MRINGIAQFVEGLGKKREIGKDLFKFTEAIADSGTLTRSRLSLSGDELKLLPKQFRGMLNGVKRPTVHIGYQGGKGQATMGFAVSSGNKPVGRFVYNLDKTRGSVPTFETRLRVNLPAASEETDVVRGVLRVNPNKDAGVEFASHVSKENGAYKIECSRGDAFELNAHFNPENSTKFSHNFGFPMPQTKEIQEFPNAMEHESRGIVEEFKNLFKPKKVKTPKKVKASKPAPNLAATKAMPRIDNLERSFLPEVEEILKIEGEIKGAKLHKAKSLILKKMGYDPEIIPTVTVRGAGDASGEFGTLNGQMRLHEEFLEQASNYEVASTIIHELDHMDVLVKTAKKIGLDKFEKLMMQGVPSEEKFNREFYQKAMKFVDTSDFNAKPVVNAIKRQKAIDKMSYESNVFYRGYTYLFDEMEIHARNAEERLLAEVQRAGHNQTSVLGKIEASYGKLQPHGDRLETILKGKSAEQKSELFNAAWAKALEEQKPGAGAAYTRILNGDDSEEAIKAYGLIRGELMNSEEDYLKILERTIELI